MEPSRKRQRTVGAKGKGKLPKCQSVPATVKSNKKKKLSKYEAEVAGENLLLNYTYHLDDCHNRKIVLGFDPSSFEAKIVFHRHGLFPVSASFSEWSAVYKHLNELKTKMEETLPANQLELNNEHRIPINNNSSIILKQTELYKLFELLTFFNIIMYHNNNASDSVKEYYKKYAEKCKGKSVLTLTCEDFFIPSRTSYVHLNYSRLFYEIPLFCINNLIFDTINFQCI